MQYLVQPRRVAPILSGCVLLFVATVGCRSHGDTQTQEREQVARAEQTVTGGASDEAEGSADPATSDGSADAPAAPTPTPGSSPTILSDGIPCEVSAAAIAPWDADLLILGDNEEHGELFLARLTESGVELAGRLELPDERRPRDIEALTTSGDELLIFGSHGRNSRCERKDKRMRARRVARQDDGTLRENAWSDLSDRWDEISATVDGCVQGLFLAPPPAGAAQVCEAIVAAERAAAAGQSCATFSIEGAVTLPRDDFDRIWIGLRAPTVDGAAVLLRVSLVDLGRYDGVAFAELGGRGVRGMERSGDRVWGLAGPVADSEAPFALWSAPVGDVGPHGERIETVEIHDESLPTSTEGIVARDQTLWLFVDGDQPADGETTCRAPSRWYSRELPTAP